MRDAWRPLLAEPLAARATDAVRAIAAELASAAPRAGGLGDGSAGLALYFAAVGEREAAAGFWEQALDGVAGMPVGLVAGLSGIGWAAARLGPESLDPDSEQEIEDALVDVASDSPWTRPFDLVSGLAGMAVYGLERLPRPGAVTLLQRIVDRLAELAVAVPPGLAFRTRPEHMTPERARRFPDGYFDLGLAHGIAGVAAVLARIAAAGVARARARSLLDGAVAWLLDQRLAAGSEAVFADAVFPGVEPAPTRSAWCYGDPGVAVALLGAARAVGHRGWEQAALEVARRAARRDPAGDGVVDACLCHGAAGLGHLYNRIHQATGDAELGAAARACFERTLAMRAPGRGLAGFEYQAAAGAASEPGLLAGAAGIGLALQAATSHEPPSWDGFILLENL